MNTTLSPSKSLKKDTKGILLNASILIMICLACLVGMTVIMPLELIADEVVHVLQVMLFLAGQYYLGPITTVPPGYHTIITGISTALDIHYLTGFRIIHSVLSLSAVGFAWWYWQLTRPSYPLIQSLQLLATPLLWPFYWTMYADLTSAAIVITGLLLTQQRKYGWAAAIGLLSLCFRQHNVFWIVLNLVLALDQEGFLSSLYKELTSPLKKKWGLIRDLFINAFRSTWVFLIPLFAFIIFVILNHGIAVGDRTNQTFGGLYPIQLFGFVLVLWILLLPLHIANLPKIIRLLLNKPVWIPALAILLLVFLFTYTISHPHNFRSDYFLRNWFLYQVKDMFKYQLYAYLAIAWSLLSLAVTPFRQKTQYWLYPISTLALLPVWLIEQRYYIVPFILFMLFRVPQARGIEIVILIWSILLSIPLTIGFTSMKFFL